MGHKSSCAVYDPVPSSCDCGYYSKTVHAKCDSELESLRAQLAEKDKEIERLRKEVVNRNQRALDGDKAAANSYSLYEALLEAQAENAKLRDVVNLWLGSSLEEPSLSLCIRYSEEALSIPPNTSALAEVVARAGEVMRERAATVIWDGPVTNQRIAIRALPGVTIKDISNG